MNYGHAATTPYLQITKSQLKVDTFTQKGYVISIYDETENARLIHEVNELRSHDIMTGLFNRNYFEEIQKTIDYSDEKICMILLDVDGLKLRNDYLGHSEGDRLLIDFSSYLSEVIKPYKSAVGIRLGGDEFMVILRDCDEDVVDDVIHHLKVLCDENQGKRRISFSYGFSIRKNKKDNLLAIMKRCDLMLYEEKAKRIEYRKRLEKELKSNI